MTTRSKSKNAKLASYKCSCGDGLEAKDCPFLGRCREPLAWSLDDQLVLDQSNCLLFNRIPKELRDLIWEFALTDCTSHPSDRERFTREVKVFNRRRPTRMLVQRSAGLPSDIASSLLQTCRAVYLETYTLPLSLNPYVASDMRRYRQTKDRLPWQFAYVQGLDFTFQQTTLEGEGLRDVLLSQMNWMPEARHTGVYVAPLRMVGENNTYGIESCSSSFEYALIPAGRGVERRLRLSDALRQAPGYSQQDESLWWSSAMRVTLARPLIHLTLRLGREDWWTWTDDPDSFNETHQLGLDPALGDGGDGEDTRATSSRMRRLANERRAGRYPDVGPRALNWGSVVGSLPDLKSLELVLETFANKTAQLENVVECAKTWRFPIHGTQYRLVWDGKVETKRWSKEVSDQQRPREDAPWYHKCTTFEVRIVRFTRKRAM